MRKLLIGLFLLIGITAEAQVWSGSQVQISQFGRLKRLIVKPTTPAATFGIWYNLWDSLHFETPTKDWNLGKILYQDSLGYYYLKTQTDSIVAKVMDTVHLYADSLAYYYLKPQTDSIGNKIMDTVWVYVDSINLLQDTALIHDTRLRNLEGKAQSQDIWQKDPDSTTSSKYPVNISSLAFPPDSRVIVGNLPNINAPYNDTLSIGYILSGEYIFQLFGIADGTGGLKKYGVKIVGVLEADSTNIGYIWGDSINTNKYLLNGDDINKTGTLDSVAYRNRDNNFLKEQTIQGHLHAADVHATDSISAANFFASGLVKTAHFQLTTTPSNGYVLKCDADGNGSWQALTNSYKGTWDAHTNTPEIVDSIGAAGDFYLVSVGDTIDLGSGNIIFLTGGTVIYNGSKWEAINPSQIVTSVNSLIGDIQLNPIISGDTLWITGATDSVNLEMIPAIGNLQDSTTNHTVKYYEVLDSIKIHRDSLDHYHIHFTALDDSLDYHTVRYYILLDSLAAHTARYYGVLDSLAVHSGWFYQILDSIAVETGRYYVLLDSLDVHRDTLTAYRERIEALEGKTDAQDIWQKDSDSTASAKYPINLSSLKLPPDSRIVPFNLPVTNAPHGDTVSLSTIIGGNQVSQLYGIPDGAGGLLNYGVKIGGSLDVTGELTGANINNYFQKEISADAENNIPVGFPIGSKTKVFYNGTLIEQTKWTGSGTSTITLSLDTRKYDVVTITN